MIERVGEERRAASAQRRQRREIRHVAGAEAERARRIDEAAAKRGEIVFELSVRTRMTAEQMRAAAARAVVARALGERGCQCGMRGEAEIVVTSETDDRAAID